MVQKENIHTDAEKVIEINGLYKAFGSYQVLENASLDLYKGENLVVLGKSGTGKSVLIKIIVGLLRPDSGLVKVLDHIVDEISYEELLALRLRVGFSFQNSALYDSMTVKENLEFPLVRNRRDMGKSDVNALVEEMLDAVGLSQTINQMPSELSGGQRKRIGIARTLMLKPEIMLYDEPTAGLDPITSKEINKLINTVQERYHTSAIVITHDLTCAKETGNRVAMLVERSFERQGSFEQIFNTGDPQAQPFFDYNFIQ
ncbi:MULTISPECIES: ABC transporter ATP-binding protein [Pedobacter]|jgi:phospholipid/cholesterol/gamma-HCH transport system ATP-binding protein|uniref:ATP-binding cassette domain-containing protein n=1 Tax=Pedobacter agri TaxID=454586 RepID=A0A9X3DGT3_9SPHI|nr:MULTISPECIES: ATP-binding cassette domain-containing protein [Pedobacter]AZI27367.1 ATP-binding cassette domain-containing protein [Pedobacter sp. G11]MCX3267533.1 ATP-binding cassette domain-containing protein [Pedobacter agri]MDQ1139095.1 phospholipid/cholesterol/gamma-HCH transport system ATP-binding protein [Pedobacter agri]